MEDSDSMSRCVWCTGSFDLAHYGHGYALKQAKEMGDRLVVQLYSDDELRRVSQLPIFPYSERCQLVRGMRWVDEVIEAAPTTIKLHSPHTYSCRVGLQAAAKDIDENHCLSTSLIIQRILARKQKVVVPGPTFLLTDKKLFHFYSPRRPLPTEKVVYAAGTFDLFHVGHLSFLERARALGDYLVVGVYPDHVRPLDPVMTLYERVMTLLSFKCVDEVVIGAPYHVTKDLIKHFQVSIVADGSKTDIDGSMGMVNDIETCDPNETAKQLGIYTVVDSGSSVTTTNVINKVIDRYKQPEELGMGDHV